MAIGAMGYCRKIRNQYAHCHWYDDWSGRLAFVNVEDLATSNDLLVDFDNLTRCYVDMPTLSAQESYFNYTDALLSYANYEGRYRTGELKNQPIAKPKHLEQPLLHL